MKYRCLRYIFYPTQTYDPAQPYGLGDPYTVADDALYRAQFMVNVLRYARSNLPDVKPQNPLTGVKEADVLKIFMAPEFYLRSSLGQRDGTGHYSMFEVQEARQVIRHAVLSDKAFDDWLILPGTAVYAQQRVSQSTTPVIFNEAWVLARSPKFESTYQKQYFSDEDNLDVGSAATRSGNILTKIVKHVDRQIITYGGVDIGFEVCLDHHRKALKNTVVANGSGAPRNVDVHLLSSCGMATIDDSVAARSNGYFLRCNGNDYAPPRFQAFRVGPWPGTNQPSLGAKPALSDLQAQLVSQQLPPQLQLYDPRNGKDKIGYSELLPLP